MSFTTDSTVDEPAAAMSQSPTSHSEQQEGVSGGQGGDQQVSANSKASEHLPSKGKQLRIYAHDDDGHAPREQLMFANESGMPIPQQSRNYQLSATSPSLHASPLPNPMMLQPHAGHPALYGDHDSVFHVSGSHAAVSVQRPSKMPRPGFKRAESMMETRIMTNPDDSPLLGHSSIASNMQHGMTIMRPESTPVGPSQGYHTAYFIQHPSSGPNGHVMSYQLADGQQIFMAQSPFVQTGVQVRSLMPDSNMYGDSEGHSPMLHSSIPNQHMTHPHGGYIMNRSYSDPFSINVGGTAPDTVAMEHIVGQTVYCTPINKGMPSNGFAASPLESITSTIASTAKKATGLSITTSQPPHSARSMTPMSAHSATDSSYQPSTNGRYRTTFMNGEEGPDDDMDEDEDRGSFGRASSIARLAHNQLRRANTMLEQSTSAIPSRRKIKGHATGDALEDMKSRDAGRKAPHGLGTKSSAAAKNKEYVPENIPPGPRSSEKPPCSYAALIGQAILASSRKRLALSQIYSWISTAYPYFKPGDAGWMNSIRHNLSLNDCFIKGERGEEDAGGKGSVWMIDPVAEFQFKDGGFKKASKAKAEAAAAAAGISGGSGEGKKNGPSSSRKRKAAEIESVPLPALLQPLALPAHVDVAHHPMPYTAIPLHVATSPALQASPILNEAELSNRLRFVEGDASVQPELPSRPATAQGLQQDSFASVPRQFLNGSTGNSVPSTQETESRDTSISINSPDALQSQRKPSVIHRSALDRTTSRSQFPSNIADDTFNTPNRPLSADVQYSQPSPSIFGMLPHLTPSASSPISSSPAPSTNTKVGLMDRRMAQLSELRRPDTVRIRTVKDEYSSDSGPPEHTKPSPFPSALAPAVHLEQEVTFAAPALPLKVKRQMDSVDLAKQSERQRITLSPMHKAHRRVKSVTLPGPSELLSNSPKAEDRTDLPVDPLNHLDRLPKSPIGRAKSPTDNFATPVATSGRPRISNFTPRTLSGMTATPMRPSSLGNLMHHQTPAGLMKAQFKAEHGLLDSPMGLSGSCYDMSDASYRVDLELEHLQTRGLQSPSNYGHQRYQSVVFGYDQSP
ncbi:hypothetical protein NCC49_005443 [Naganishia albida]|nr:hypothetical protein NCC49_005443 [Naganishia albida]